MGDTQSAFKNVILIRVELRFMLSLPRVLGGNHGEDH
jgi:hypothetical protein